MELPGGAVGDELQHVVDRLERQVVGDAFPQEQRLGIVAEAVLGQQLAERLLGEIDADEGQVLRQLGIASREQLLLARLRAGMVELEHLHAAQLVLEAEGARVVAGAEDHHLLDAGAQARQKRFVEVARAGDGEAVAARCGALDQRPQDALRRQPQHQAALQAQEVLGEQVAARRASSRSVPASARSAATVSADWMAVSWAMAQCTVLGL